MDLTRPASWLDQRPQDSDPPGVSARFSPLGDLQRGGHFGNVVYPYRGEQVPGVEAGTPTMPSVV